MVKSQIRKNIYVPPSREPLGMGTNDSAFSSHAVVDTGAMGATSGPSPVPASGVISHEATHVPVREFRKHWRGADRGPDIHSLCEQARAIRDQAWGRRVTYSRKLFIPLTNMCRDSCGYCAFVQSPDSGHAHVMTPDEVRASVRAGEQAGCKEVLFSLGEKPELRYAAARRALDRLGHGSMIDYLEAMCELVLRETTMLPHVNAGTLSDDELARLRRVSASMGLMLESTSKRLLRKGQAHHACPDKVPKRRLATLERGGQHRIPFTTGILIGIGESWQERIASLEAINELHRRHGHIQEVIVQNFRAKPGTRMQSHPEPTRADLVRTLAAARLVLDSDISLQVPPNLTLAPHVLLDGGINDWGGISPVTADFINPERPWPAIDELARTTAAAGHELAERLTVYPRYIQSKTDYLHPRLAERAQALSRADGLASVQYTGTHS